MENEKLAELGQRINNLTKLLSYMSMQLGAAMEMGMTALPKVQQEFEAVKAMAGRMGISTSAGPAADERRNAAPVTVQKANAEYLNALRAAREVQAGEGREPEGATP